MPISPAEQTSQMPETSFQFVLCRHTPEYAAEAAALAADSEIIAFESAGLYKDERNQIEQILTRYVAEDTTDEARKYVTELFAKASIDMGWQLAVLNHFPSSNKQVKLVDASYEDEAYKSIQKVKTSENNYHQSLIDAAPLPETIQALDESIQAMADMMTQREELMIDQLTDIAARNPGTKIAVLLGASHTQVQHRTQKRYVTDRTFVVGGSDKPPAGPYDKAVKVSFVPKTEAARQLHFKVAEKIGDRALKAMLFEDMYLVTTGHEIPGKSIDYSEKELNGLLEQLIQIRSSWKQAPK